MKKPLKVYDIGVSESTYNKQDIRGNKIRLHSKFKVIVYFVKLLFDFLNDKKLTNNFNRIDIQIEKR